MQQGLVVRSHNHYRRHRACVHLLELEPLFIGHDLPPVVLLFSGTKLNLAPIVKIRRATAERARTGTIQQQRTTMEPEELTYQFLQEITDGFSEERKVGQGGFGSVYKGVTKTGLDVAVKIPRDRIDLDLDFKQFENEFDNLMKVKHVNIVQFLGYCYEIKQTPIECGEHILFAEKTRRALCFEYLHNGSLQNHLSDESSGFDWHTRYKIIKGICEGLRYIHEEELLLHLDLKPDNILLDKNMVPKIADFGLSKIFGGDELTRTTESPLGTRGYQPPEFIKKGEISKKFDIFSLGVIIINIVSGPEGYHKCLGMHHSGEFIDQVQRNWKKRFLACSNDFLLEACYCCRQVETCTLIALKCLDEESQERPDIVEIIDNLKEIESDNCKETHILQPTENRHNAACRMTMQNVMKETEEYQVVTSVGDELIVGRDEEKQKIMTGLHERIKLGKIVILPIYGIGGIGKTTFVKLIYNDTYFKDYSHVWVYVSQRFDLEKIFESIESQLSGKMILIVLDDLWEDNSFKLQKLKDMLNLGDSIEKVIVLVTTRSADIAKRICSNIDKPYQIESLTAEMCWDIIKQKSVFEAIPDKEKLVHIGKEIAEKCRGVALAAQTLGSMLHSMEYNQWIKVRDSSIWNENISKDASLPQHVLASLKLSYDLSMDNSLKKCFTYCAIFPKGYKIRKCDLIYQWDSLDFIMPSKMLSTLELCEKYIARLLGLSFLQHDVASRTTYRGYGENDSVFTMHDLVHDLAVSLLGDKILDQSIQDNTGGTSCFYALLADCSKPLESCMTSARLSALRFLDCQTTELHGAAFELAESLRVLDLSECLIQKLPDSIGRLKQLRYLNAARVRDRMVPECITKFSNLRYLSLRGSCAILALPESIGEMEDLVHLDLSGCTRIEKVPESFGNLKSLEHVDFTDCIKITGVSECLGGLTKLQYLNLSACICVGDLPTIRGSLTELQYLNLSDSSYLNGHKIGEAEFWRSLTKLKYLNLSDQYKQLTNKVVSHDYQLSHRNKEITGRVVSHDYRRLWEFPEPFGKLFNLVHLDLSYCRFGQGLISALNGLNKLQYLDLSFSNPIYPSMAEMEEHAEVFGYLSELRHLNLCCYIDRIIAGQDKINSLLDRICTLTNLEYLNLSCSRKISSVPEALGNLRKLHTLDLSCCNNLDMLPANISKLRRFKLVDTYVCANCVNMEGEMCMTLYSKMRSRTSQHFRISELEQVKSAKEARAMKFVNLTNIDSLSLEWTRDAKRCVDDAEVLGELDPPYSIFLFNVRGYNSVRFPSWVMRIDSYLPQLIKIGMWDMPNCNILPPLGQLPNLEYLIIKGMDSIKEIGADLYGGPRPFPRLIYFSIRDMKWLEEWNTANSSDEDDLDDTVLRFPCLNELLIKDCPRLRFKPRPPRSMHDKFELSIKHSDDVMLSPRGNVGDDVAASTVKILEVKSCMLPLHRWTLLTSLPCLQDLRITDCSDLTCSSMDFFRGLTSLTRLTISEHLRPYGNQGRSIVSLPEGLGGLPSLTVLKIRNCEGITTLSGSIEQHTCLRELAVIGCKSIVSLPEGLGDLTSLTKLCIRHCKGIKSLPGTIGDLACLEKLYVQHCESIVSLPERLGDLTSLIELDIQFCTGIKALPRTIEQLTCLRKLTVAGCPEVTQWCKSKENKMKLAHIKINTIFGDLKSIIEESETYEECFDDEGWSKDEDLGKSIIEESQNYEEWSGDEDLGKLIIEESENDEEWSEAVAELEVEQRGACFPPFYLPFLFFFFLLLFFFLFIYG